MYHPPFQPACLPRKLTTRLRAPGPPRDLCAHGRPAENLRRQGACIRGPAVPPRHTGCSYLQPGRRASRSARVPGGATARQTWHLLQRATTGVVAEGFWRRMELRQVRPIIVIGIRRYNVDGVRETIPPQPKDAFERCHRMKGANEAQVHWGPGLQIPRQFRYLVTVSIKARCSSTAASTIGLMSSWGVPST